MGINVKLDAFGPGQHRLATKYEQEIGAMMLKDAKAQKANPSLAPQQQQASRSKAYNQELRARQAKYVMRELLDQHRATRDTIFKAIKAKKLKISRDGMMIALLEWRARSIIEEQKLPTGGVWIVKNMPEALRIAER